MGTLQVVSKSSTGTASAAGSSTSGSSPTGATWLTAIRAPSLSATIAPAVATLLLGAGLGWEMRPWIAFFAVLGVLAVQIGVNLMNDVEDYRRGIDVPGSLGGSGVLQHGRLTVAAVARAGWISFAIGLAAGLPALFVEASLWPVLAVAALGAWGYSGGPGLKYRALGDLAVVALCGPVLTIGIAISAFGTFDASVVALGLAFGFAAIGILHTNNHQDMEDDVAHGARTVASLLGEQASQRYLMVVYVLGLLVWPVAAAVAGLPLYAVLAPLLVAPVFIAHVRKMLRYPRHAPELRLARVDAAKAHLALGAAITLGLLAFNLWS